MAKAVSQTERVTPKSWISNQAGASDGQAAKIGMGTNRLAVMIERISLRNAALSMRPSPTIRSPISGRLLLAGDLDALQRLGVLGDLGLAGREAVGIEQEGDEVAIFIRRQAAALALRHGGGDA